MDTQIPPKIQPPHSILFRYLRGDPFISFCIGMQTVSEKCFIDLPVGFEKVTAHITVFVTQRKHSLLNLAIQSGYAFLHRTTRIKGNDFDGRLGLTLANRGQQKE